MLAEGEVAFVKTIWRQIADKTAIDCYNEAVYYELIYPSEPSKAFRGYYVAALLGNKDAAFHIAMAFDIGHDVKQSKRLLQMWVKFCISARKKTEIHPSNG